MWAEWFSQFRHHLKICSLGKFSHSKFSWTLKIFDQKTCFNSSHALICISLNFPALQTAKKCVLSSMHVSQHLLFLINTGNWLTNSFVKNTIGKFLRVNTSCSKKRELFSQDFNWTWNFDFRGIHRKNCMKAKRIKIFRFL